MNKVIEQIRPFCEHLNKTNVGYIGKLKPEVQTQPEKLIPIHERIKSAGGKLSQTTLTFTIPLEAENEPPSATGGNPEVPSHEDAKEEETTYNLAASKEGIGELAPVLKDAFGNIIDGFHRKGENASWHELAVPHIDTPIKLELARLAVNFARRKVPPEELKQRIKFLMENGLKPDEIVTKTGIGKTTIYKYAPQELKDKKKAETGKMGGIASGEARETLGSSANQTFQTQNTQAEPADPAPANSEANAEPKELPRGTETSAAAETKPAEIQPTRPTQPAQPTIVQPPTEADDKIEEAKRKAADEYKVEEAKRKGLVKKIVEFCPESVAKWTIDTFSWKSRKSEEEFATFLTIIIDIEHSVLAKHNLLDEVKMEAEKWK